MKHFLFLLVVMSAVACSPATVTPTPAPWTEGYAPGVDASVGCPNIPIENSDIAMTTAGDVLTISANVNRKPGLFSNAIAGKHIEQVPGVYRVVGEFRWPEGYDNESQDINLQWVEGSTEWYSEIFISLNPESPLYGWVWTRNNHIRGEEILLFQIPIDNNWHSFELVSDHANHITKSIRVDDNYQELNIPMGTVAKEWESSFMILLESTNKFPGHDANGNCLTINNYTGASEFRNVSVMLQ